MADFHTLIARAVGGLSESKSESRRALYMRARFALGEQLRSFDPPLNDIDIINQQLALEEAIRAVEAEAGKDTRAEDADTANDRRWSRDDASVPPRASPASEERQLLVNADRRESSERVVTNVRGAGPEANRSARGVYAEVPAGRLRHIEPPVPGARDPVIEPSAAESFEVSQLDELLPAKQYDERSWPPAPQSPPVPSYDDAGHAHAGPLRSYARPIKLVLLLLVFPAVAGAAYWQSGPLTSSLASLRTVFEEDTLDIVFPLFGYVAVALIIACVLLRGRQSA